MMIYPPMSDLAEKAGSRYLLVNLVAARAREISDRDEAEDITPDIKPVSEAIEEIYNGSLTVDK